MTIEDIALKMIKFSEASAHDINHFLKVWSYAKIIGTKEKLSPHLLFIVEFCALVHDIACPMLRAKFGKASGKLQEEYGPDMIRELFSESDIDSNILEEVCKVVSIHHTYNSILNIEHQIMIEADYIANAEEMSLDKMVIENFRDKVFKTKTGIELLNSVFALN